MLEDIKTKYKNIIFPFLYFVVYIASISLLLLSNQITIVHLFLLLFIYLPILLLLFYTKIYGLIFLLISIIGIYFPMPIASLIFLFLVIIPTIIPIVMIHYGKYKHNITHLAFYISLYFIIIMVGSIIYYSYTNPQVLLFDKIYDLIHFIIIDLESSSFSFDLESLKLSKQDINKYTLFISAFLPAIIVLIFLLIFLLNYQLFSYFTSQKSTKTQDPYDSPFALKWILLLSAIFSIVIHKYIANGIIFVYILYNVFLILWFCYYNIGFTYVSSVLKKQRALHIIFFYVLFGFFFMEIVLLLCFLGFLIDNNVIAKKYIHK